MSPTKAVAKEAKEKVSKREFVRRLARKTKTPLATAEKMYDAFIGEIIDLSKSGYDVTLTGFGRFYLQEHAGHSVQFASGEEGKVDSYRVLKFSATREVNRSLSPGNDDAGDGKDKGGSTK